MKPATTMQTQMVRMESDRVASITAVLSVNWMACETRLLSDV
jgi:hypothetical protein